MSYVSQDPEECQLTDFDCGFNGAERFDHPECGCGCYAKPEVCTGDLDCPLGYCEMEPRVVQCELCPVVPQQVCYPHQCDDGPVLCDVIPPTCPGTSVAAARDGCWVCVDPRSCDLVRF